MDLIDACRSGGVREAAKHARRERNAWAAAALDQEKLNSAEQRKFGEEVRKNHEQEKRARESKKRELAAKASALTASGTGQLVKSHPPPNFHYTNNSLYGALPIIREIPVPLSIRDNWVNKECAPGKPESMRSATSDLFVSFKQGTFLPNDFGGRTFFYGFLYRQEDDQARFFRRGEHQAPPKDHLHPAVRKVVEKKRIEEQEKRMLTNGKGGFGKKKSWKS